MIQLTVLPQACLTHNAKVYLACRNAEKTKKAIDELRELTGGKEALFHQLDLADLKAVKRSAEEFLKCVSYSFVFPTPPPN